MNLQLDMKTMFTSLVIGHLFTAVLISAYWRHHMKDRTVSNFFFAKCIQAAAWFFQILRGGISEPLAVSLANSLLFVGTALEVIAVLHLQNAFGKVTRKFYIMLTAFNLIGFHCIMIFNNVEAVRLVFVSFAISAMLLLPAYRMVLQRSSSLLMRTMGYFYLFVIVVLWSRAAVALFSGYSMGLFTLGIYQTVSFLALYLVMISGNTGFALLMKERADQELIRLASFDDLTGTMNRRMFVTQVKQTLIACTKKKKPISLLLFDVDQFKTINDTYGHDVGDKVLIGLTEQIKQSLDGNDLFARYGGDEFAILLPGKDEAESTELAERIRQRIDTSVIPGMPVKCSISLGVLTVIPDQHTQLETLYTSCDQALYNAKRNGRNGIARSRISSSLTT